MSTSELLAKLESAQAHKNDPLADYAEMADTIRAHPGDPAIVQAALATWLRDEEPRWHAAAAIELADLLRSETLITEAVAEARKRGIKDEDPERWTSVPAWLEYQLLLIATIARFPAPAGIEYLRELRGQAHTAWSATRRELSMRAWISLCLVGPADDRAGCVLEALATLRSWRAPALTRLVVGPLNVYASKHPQFGLALRHALTDEERRLVFGSS